MRSQKEIDELMALPLRAPEPSGRKPLPTNPWHRAILAAYLRRCVSEARMTWSGDFIGESPDYHPAKAVKIIHRFEKIIDLYL
jgi:hypothetical protein